MVNQGGISPVCEILKFTDHKMAKVALDTLDNILKHGQGDDGENSWADLVEECGGLDTIEDLQEHENEDIYQKYLHLIESYFGDDDDEDESLPVQNGFQLGGPQPAIQQQQQQQQQFNFTFA
jgi:hypothetical protein